MTSWKANLLHFLTGRVLRAPRRVVAAALVLAALSVLYTVGNLQFKTDRGDLVSAGSYQRRLTKERFREFGDRDGFVVVIENRDRAESLAFLAALARRLQDDSRHFDDVFYRVDPKAFANRALLYLDPEDLVTLREKLREHRAFVEGLAASPDLATFFRLVNQRVTSGLVGELFTGFLDEPKEKKVEAGPVDLGFLTATLRQVNAWLDGGRTYTSPWEAFFTNKRWKASPDGYLWTENERFLLLMVTPRENDQGFNKAEVPLQRLRAAIAAVRARHPRVAVGVTGKDALETDEMTAAMRDTTLATVISLIGFGLLMIFFLRGVTRPALEVATLGIALCWTFGAATLLVGHLNLLSVVFTPLLLGLGVDYGIHLLARYEEQRRRGRSVRVALERSLLAVGPGIVTAALTATACFLALTLTDFLGLRELGLITGTGILLSLAASLVVLPALVMLKERGWIEALSEGPGPPAEEPRPFLAFAYRRPVLVVAAGIGLAALSLGALQGVGFDLNPLHMQTEGAESVRWELKLLGGSDRSTASAEIIARSLDEVRFKTAALQALPTVSRVESILTFLPEEQEKKLQLLRTIRPLLQGLSIEPGEARPVELDALGEALDRIRFKMVEGGAETPDADPSARQRAEVRGLIEAYRAKVAAAGPDLARERLAAFEQALFADLADKVHTLRANVTGGPMTADGLPETLRKRYIGLNGLYLVRAYPAEDIWDPGPLGRFVADLQSVDADVLGDPVGLHIYTQAFRRAYEQATIYALIAIFILVLVDFQSLGHALLATAPLLVGTAWTVGLMWVFGVPFNLANVIFLPLIIGAGVENGIIVLYRWREEGAVFRGLPASTGMGVALASLSTTVGFASLMISGHRGVHSLGLLLTLGTICVLAASLTVLPGLLRLLAGRRRIAAPPAEALSPQEAEELEWPRGRGDRR
ncbi:MAG TPA: MMPL family transporter [Candidatus Sulfotelmatobacter sp.]|nr:MMPL family transporter [Candidatus Sulfotelmatobacter sp.]